MRISLVTDEVSADLDTALELAREWGVEGVELRGVGGARFPDLPGPQRRRIPEQLARWRLPVVAISPGLFKVPLRDTAAVRDHLDRLLPLSLEAARELGAQVVVCFGLVRDAGEPPGPAPDEAVDILREAALRALASRLTLALEPEDICWADTGERTADMVTRAGSGALGVNWDPANAYRAGDDRAFPDGYLAVRGLVRHVHYKQAAPRPDGGRGWSLEGVIDWKGQMEALRRDGYTGWISAETHITPKVAMSRQVVRDLRALAGKL